MLVGPEQQKKLYLTLDHIVQTNKHWRKSEKEGTFICYGANLFLASLQLGMIMGLHSGHGDVNCMDCLGRPVKERPLSWVLYGFPFAFSPSNCQDPRQDAGARQPV